MGALSKRLGAVRPENGNVMGWLTSLVSTLPSPVTREWPRSGESVVVLRYGLAGRSGVDATSLPSGEKATALTQAERPSSVRRAAPVAGSQSRTALLVLLARRNMT